MGKRGRGALTKEKPEKQAHGRPTLKIDPEAAKHVKPLIAKAVEKLDALLGSADERVRLRAVKIVLDHGMRLPASEVVAAVNAAKKGPGELRVVFDADWREASKKS